MRHIGAHFRFPSDADAGYNCKVHSCPGSHSVLGYTATAGTTTTSLGMPLIVAVPPTPTPSEIDSYSWHW